MGWVPQLLKQAEAYASSVLKNSTSGRKGPLDIFSSPPATKGKFDSSIIGFTFNLICLKDLGLKQSD